MKTFSIITLTFVIILVSYGGTPDNAALSSYMYAGLPSQPLENEDSEDDIGDDFESQEGGPVDSGTRRDAPEPSSGDDFDDWYEPEENFQ